MNKKTVELYSAGCPLCQEAEESLKKTISPVAEIKVLNLNDNENFKKAKELGIHRAPAVVIDGKLADCCSVSKPDESVILHQIEEIK